jgi:hypothetical protein
LPDHARYAYLLNLPEEKDIAKALKEAMKAIEEYRPDLEGATRFQNPKGISPRAQGCPAARTLPLICRTKGAGPVGISRLLLSGHLAELKAAISAHRTLLGI